MTGVPIHDVLGEALRALFIIGLPVVVISAVAGTVTAAFQSVTTAHEASVGYAAKLIAVLVVLYLFAGDIVTAMTRLAQMAFQ